MSRIKEGWMFAGARGATLAALVLAALPARAAAQTMPPPGPTNGVAEPQTFARILAWEPVPGVNVLYDVSLNGTNLMNTTLTRCPVNLPPGTNTFQVWTVVGTNRSAPATLKYVIASENRISVWLESGPTPLGPFTPTNTFAVTNATGSLFARAGIRQTRGTKEGPTE